MLRISPAYQLSEPPYGPRSQGCIDEDALAALNELLALPRITQSVLEAEDSRVAEVLYELHAAAVPEVLVYPDARRAELFKVCADGRTNGGHVASRFRSRRLCSGSAVGHASFRLRDDAHDASSAGSTACPGSPSVKGHFPGKVEKGHT